MATTYQKLQIVTKSVDFKAATQIVEVPLREPEPNELRIRQIYGAVNATDLNQTAGRNYGDGSYPFDVGLEALGFVDAIGSAIPTGSFKIGQPVLVFDRFKLNGFSQYSYKPVERVIPVPELKPEYLGTLTNGLTASIALDKKGQIQKGDKVLVTAAAGGTGQIAVQWAKHRGAFVIALTSSEEKAKYLKELGADFVINYKKDNLNQVLTDQFPEGVDVVWETIGGDTFKTLFNHLSISGRMIIIGSITSYKTEVGIEDVPIPNLNQHLLRGSKTISGFVIWNHFADYPEYLPTLISAIEKGKLKVQVDYGETAPGGRFVGLDQVYRAEEWLYSGKSVGKIVVQLQNV